MALDQRICAWALTVSLLWLCARAHAEIPEGLRGATIVEVSIAGESAGITQPSETGITLGQPLSRALVRRSIGKLLASGRFLDVQVDALPADGGVELVFRLEPRIVLRRVDIEGPTALEEQVLRDALGLGEGSQIDRSELEARAAAVRKAYAERGYLVANVDVSFRDTDPPSLKVLRVIVTEGAPTRITELSLQGQSPPAVYKLFAAMGLAKGDVLNRQKIAESVERGARYLRGHGYLEAHMEEPLLTLAEGRAQVVFPTHVGPRYTLHVVGATPLLPREVVDSLDLTAVPLSAESFDTLPAKVRDFYARSGFLDAKVRVRRRAHPGTRATRATLRFDIDPGPQVEVVDVSFPGSSFYPHAFLYDQVASYLEEDLPGADLLETVDSEVADLLVSGDAEDERKVPRPPLRVPARTYYAPTYAEAVKHIDELYQAEGFLSVQVGPPSLERIGARHATVNIPVVEGPRTRLHGVVLRGQETVSERELLVASGLTRDAPFSYLALEQARLRILELYHERGHMFARALPSVRFSGDRTRAEITFEIVERFPVYVGDLVVRGADRTSTSFIESLLELKKGDLFRPSKARASEAVLQSLGVFTGVSVDMQDPDLAERVKPLVITVAERKNQYLDFSAGVSTGQGVRAGFEYGYRNLFGRAVSMSLRVQFAHQLFFVREDLRERFEQLSLEKRLERNVALGTVIPRIPGLGSTRTAIDLVHVRDNERDFGLDKNGVTVAFTQTPLRYVTLLEAVDLENNNVDLFTGDALDDYLAMTTDQRLRRLLRVPEGNTTLAALRLGIAYDRRDSPFVPTKGYFASTSAEIASTLTSETVDTGAGQTQYISRFLKLQLAGSGYVPLAKNLVLAGQARIGRIIKLVDESETYPNRAFFLGGVDTMRGFFQDELMPQDIADLILSDPNLQPNSIVRSGNAFLLLRGELRFPIYEQLGGAVFTDLGNLWEDATKLNPFDLRPTAGAGLRLSTPVGPIAVDYGIVLKRRRGLDEPFGTLHFSIGLF